MARSLVDVDFRQALDLASGLSRLSGERFQQIGVETVNAVAERARPKFIADMASVNLPTSYLNERIGLRLATTVPTAVIYAPFKTTMLSRYDPRQLTAPARSKARGSAARGIPAGQKAAGVTVEVKRGVRKLIGNGFLMPLKSGNGTGVFTRDPLTKKVRNRYGPAVYQLFSVGIGNLEDDIGLDLELTALSEADRAIEELL